MLGVRIPPALPFFLRAAKAGKEDNGVEKIDRAKEFLAESRQELKKVTWPTKQQTTTSTWVVLVVTFVLAIFLGLVDLVFSKLVGLILN